MKYILATIVIIVLGLLIANHFGYRVHVIGPSGTFTDMGQSLEQAWDRVTDSASPQERATRASTAETISSPLQTDDTATFSEMVSEAPPPKQTGETVDAKLSAEIDRLFQMATGK